MDKALELYEDIYGQWRTYYELWRFNFIDEKMKDAQKFSEKLIRLQPEYPQSYIAYLASHEKGASIRSMKSKLNQLLPNFSPPMIKNFHSWIRDDQADRIIQSLKKHLI